MLWDFFHKRVNWNIIFKLYKYMESLQSNRNKIKKHPYRILLVDDEPDVTLGFEIGLEDNGFVVGAFNDPVLALSSFKEGLYALALLSKTVH